MVARQLGVIDAVHHGEVGSVARCRDEHALGACGEVGRGLLLGNEDARAFHRDVDAEFPMRQRRRILDGRHLDGAAADVDGVAGHLDFVRKPAVHAVEAKQVGVGFDRAEVVDADDLDIVAAGFEYGAQDVAADPSEPVDGDLHGHEEAPLAL